jgi:hypothetical protein
MFLQHNHKLSVLYNTTRETALSSSWVSDTIPSTVWVFDRVLRRRRPMWGDTMASTLICQLTARGNVPWRSGLASYPRMAIAG